MSRGHQRRSRRPWACAPQASGVASALGALGLRGAIASLGLSVLAASGCASGAAATTATYTPPGQTELKVAQLRIVGLDKVEGLDADELLAGLSTKPDPGWRTWAGIAWVPLLSAPPSYFNTVEWRTDRQRILNYCYAQGYFNASLAKSENTNRKEKTISLKVTINAGKPTRVSQVRVLGLDGLGLPTTTTLKVGDRFTQEGYLSARGALYRQLRQASYAYARVQGVTRVDPATRQAQVTFYVDPGPKARIDQVQVRGLKDEAKLEGYVREAITLKRGQEFSDTALQETQESIYDLGIFSMVSVQPAFELQEDEASSSPQEGLAQPQDEALERTSGALGPLGVSQALLRAQQEAQLRAQLTERVDVVIQLKEAKPVNVRLGAGFSIDSARQDVHLQANWSARNLGGSLVKLEHLNTIGYAVTPGLIGLAASSAEDGSSAWERIRESVGNNGVFFDSTLELSKPQFLERRLTLFSRATVEREVQLGYIGLAPQATLGLRRRFWDNIQAEASYSVLYYRYQDLDAQFADQLIAQELILPGQRAPSQLLETLEQRVAWDVRNNALNPTRGVRVELSLQEAASYLAGGEFMYIKPQLSFEGYLPWTLGTRWVLATRARLGSIYNLNDPDGAQGARGVPVQSRFFAGGRGSLRSVPARFMSPFTENLTRRPNDQFDPVPVGGLTLAELGVEQRARLVRNLLSLGDLWGALFVDSATVLPEPLWLNTRGNSSPVATSVRVANTLIYGGGLGVWWLTPVGPLRADLAWTLSDLIRNPNYDDPQVRQRILGYNFFLGVGHSF